MNPPPMKASDRLSVAMQIEQAHRQIDLEQRCRMLAELNDEYGRRIVQMEDELSRCHRRDTGGDFALMGAMVYGAAATIAAVVLWATR